ncbi:hypothetical protein H5181_02830 [Shewanella sp. SG44-2]|uniref:hypothetical protein n=1 Tax=Shewanella sp. SG44-2 TaxID=2760962 RepID=UPI0016048D18|nr:hypothetical protein [Shewanella sp. SG44-2]MBB1425393.1 hypothetical protein [Shewanella sp. SG44-2]
MKSVLQITLGILLAGLITLLVKIGYANYVEYRVTQELNELAMQQKQAQLVRQQAAKDRQRAEYQAQQLARQDKVKRQQIAKQQEIARIRKTEAWRKYYLVPEDCKNFKSDEHMVTCINQKADLKAEFDRTYLPENIRY